MDKRFIFILLSVFLLSLSGAFAVTYDTSVNGGGATTTGSLTYSHTIANQDDRVLLVMTMGATTSGTITGVTYAGVSMTKLNENRFGTDRFTALWYLENPTIGTNNVVVSNTGSGRWAQSISYYDVDLTNSPDFHTYDGFATAGTNHNVTNTHNASVYLVNLIRDNSGGVSYTGGTNSDVKLPQTGWGSAILDSDETETGTSTFQSWTTSGAVNQGVFTIGLKAALPVTPFFEVRSQNYTSHGALYQVDEFNASLSLANGSSYDFTTTTGNITTNINESININLTITATSPGVYINQTFLNYNASNSPLYFNFSLTNITAEDGITSGAINDFNVTFKGTQSQSVNNSVLLYTEPGNYSFIGVAEGYNSLNFSFNTTLNASDYTLTLYGKNSVFVTIYNATDSVKLSQSATILVEGTNFTQSYTTSDGDEFIQNLTAGIYDFLITSSGFQSASYVVTVGENTFQNLNAYLSEDTGTDVTFTFKDQSTGSILEGVELDVEQFVNTSYILVNSLTSDISGRVQFAYVDGARYRLTADLSQYKQKQFILDPVIFNAYTVQMGKNLSDVNLQENNEVGITFTPKRYYENELHNFSITFSNPAGEFLYYNYTVYVTSNGNTISGNGANAFGGTLEGVVNVTDATITDRVIVSYRYVKSDGTDYTQQRTFTIDNSEDSVFTFSDNEGNPFGLSLFDRVVILVITVLMGSGVAYWFGGFAGSTIIGLLIFGYMGAIGIVPMWTVWASITFGAIIFIWGSNR